EEGVKVGGAAAVGLGLGAGAIVYFVLARAVEHMGPGGGGGGTALALGAILVSNLPEAIGSAVDMRAAGAALRQIRLLWLGVATACALATPLGYGLARATGGHFQAAINGFAAGALLVMLVDSMIPEATQKSGRVAGLAT